MTPFACAVNTEILVIPTSARLFTSCSTVNALASFANSYWADRYELLSRKREINQKAVSRRLEIERLTAELNDKNKQLAEKDKKIAALQKAANSTLLSKIKRAVKKLFKIK